MNIKQWASLRETSIEIAKSIFKASKNNEIKAQRIWEDPSEDEYILIIDSAIDILRCKYTKEEWENLDEAFLFWGEDKIGIRNYKG